MFADFQHIVIAVSAAQNFGTKISLIASQLQGNTPVTLLRIPLWLAGLAQHFLSALPWVRLTLYDRTSWKQQGPTGRSRCALGMLYICCQAGHLRSRHLNRTFRTRRAILNPRSAIVAVNVDFCPVPTTDIVEHAPSTLVPRRASIMNSKKKRASASDRDGKHWLYLCKTGLHSSQKAYQGRQNWPKLHNQETDSSQTWQLSCEGLYASIEWSIEFL